MGHVDSLLQETELRAQTPGSQQGTGVLLDSGMEGPEALPQHRGLVHQLWEP